MPARQFHPSSIWGAIAHCLSTIRNADRIYVLENGRIAQEGSFTQLAQQKGLFAQPIARQTL